jgi:aryl-phospho-beta-D-glucosidase BglC (GH1 family)
MTLQGGANDNIVKYLVIFFFTLLVSHIVFYTLPLQQIYGANNVKTSSGPPYNGVDMHGFYTRTSQARDTNYDLPKNYFEESFKILSSNGLNHVRFLIFWESFVKNPTEFIAELKTVAQIGGIETFVTKMQMMAGRYKQNSSKKFSKLLIIIQVL